MAGKSGKDNQQIAQGPEGTSCVHHQRTLVNGSEEYAPKAVRVGADVGAPPATALLAVRAVCSATEASRGQFGVAGLGCWRSCTLQEQDSLESVVQATQSVLSAVQLVQHLLPPHTFLPAHGDLNRAWAEVGQTTCAQLCWLVCLARFVALRTHVDGAGEQYRLPHT